MSQHTSLDTRLAALHAEYVDLVNSAVAGDDLRLADELSAAYDRDALDLMHAHLRAAA